LISSFSLSISSFVFEENQDNIPEDDVSEYFDISFFASSSRDVILFIITVSEP